MKKNKNILTIPAYIVVRDTMMVDLICGTNKGGFQKDRKKEDNRKKCRKPVRLDD